MRLLERGARRAIALIDAAATRVYGWRWNPVHQTGTVAVVMLLVLLATGLYLVLFYRVGAPSASVARIAADPWLGRWIRSLHRYASDLFVAAAALHAIRMFAQGRSWGPRTLAWVSGLTLVAMGLLCAWTGFILAWDAFGERLAREGGRLLDVVPVLSEPLSRTFAGDRPVPSAFFFVNLFVHLSVPLAMGAALWLHVSRVARPVFLPPRRIAWSIAGALMAASVLAPAALGEPANAFRIASETPVNLATAWWLPVTERLAPGVVWGAVLIAAAVSVLVPKLAARPREGLLAPSVVDPRLCTGCNQCPQDCPWEAITMVAREDGRPTLVAQVDPQRCVSCGICAGSCAPMGVGPPGRSGRDQLAALRAAIPRATGGMAPAVVVIACARSPSAHLAAFRSRGARVHEVTCLGNLHTSVIEAVLKRGARGVFVCGCPPRDCANREGRRWLHARMFEGREAELQQRVDRRRIRVATAAPGDLAGSIAEYERFLFDLTADFPTSAASPDRRRQLASAVELRKGRRS